MTPVAATVLVNPLQTGLFRVRARRCRLADRLLEDPCARTHPNSECLADVMLERDRRGCCRVSVIDACLRSWCALHSGAESQLRASYRARVRHQAFVALHRIHAMFFDNDIKASF